MENTAQKGIEKFMECIKRISNISFSSVKREVEYKGIVSDAAIEIKLENGVKRLFFLEIISKGEPRFVMNAVNKLLRFSEVRPESYGVVIAPYISEKSGEICRSNGCGFVDFAGNCYLSLAGIHIDIMGRTNPYKEKREIKKMFSPKSSRILRVLLTNPGIKRHLEELAIEADVSIGLVYKVKNLLLNQNFINQTREGVYLTKPEELLLEWSENYTYRKNRTFNYYSLKGTADREYELAEFSKDRSFDYALTSIPGAARFSPNIRYNRVVVYFRGDLKLLEKKLNLKKADTGANLILLEPYDEGVFYDSRIIEDIRTVSPIQIYLDAINFPGRGEEAAEKILKEVIRKQWETG